MLTLRLQLLGLFVGQFLFINMSFAHQNLSVENKEQCLVGSPLVTRYVDEFNKSQLTENDSFLEKYRNYQASEQVKSTVKNALSSNLLNPLFHKVRVRHLKPSTPFKESVKKEDILCSLRRVPVIPTAKKLCASSDSDILEPKNAEFYTEEVPCITQTMADYIYWGFNEALKCFGEDLDSVGKKYIFKKINLESSFGFFFQSGNGTGTTQVIPKDIQEVLKQGYLGHRFLKNYLDTNKKRCESFTTLFNKDFLINSNQQIPHCQFISIGDGMGRSLLAGVGIYIYYRSYHPASAEKILAYLGVPKSNSVIYNKMRVILALGMYNKGPGTVWDAIKVSFTKNELYQRYKSKPNSAYATFKRKIEQTSFYLYVTELESIYDKTLDKKGKCLLPLPQNKVAKHPQNKRRLLTF